MKKLLLVGMLGLSFSASAYFYNGNKLNELRGSYSIAKDRKASVSNIQDAGMFAGYVVAVFDFGDEAKLFCSPDSVTVGQATDIVEKYLIDHPEERSEQAFIIAMNALKAAFPCKK